MSEVKSNRNRYTNFFSVKLYILFYLSVLACFGYSKEPSH